MSDRGHRPNLRIVCVIPTMRGGGAERVVAELCSYLVKRGDEVHLLTLTAEDEEPFYRLHPAIRQVRLGQLPDGSHLTRVCKIARRAVTLRRAIKAAAPDLVLTHLTAMNILVLLATRGLGVPVIASEHTDIRAASRDLGSFRGLVRRLTYPCAGQITVLTKRSYDAIGEALTHKVAVIPNPITPAVRRAVPGRPGSNGRYRIIGVGRLAPEKRQHLAIEAFARVEASFPDWDLVIFGEGPLRTELQDLIRARGLSDRVMLPGLTHEVGAELSRSHVFAFPSLYEGFPMSLGEGLAAGLPAVAFANVSGVEDLILHQRTGLIADGANPIASFAEHLSRLMSNAQLRSALGAAACEYVRAWRPERVFAQWSALIDGVQATAATRGGVVRPSHRQVLPGAAQRIIASTAHRARTTAHRRY